MLFDEFNLEEYAEVRAAEALANGLAKGSAEKQLEIAKNMKSEGATVDFIQKVTGLSPDAVQQL